MKKYLLTIAIIALAYTADARYSSTLYQDTVKNLRNNIISQKSKFRNKQLTVLLNELGFTVKSYMFIRGAKPGGPAKGIILFFEDRHTVTNKIQSGKARSFLTIYFDEEVTKHWPLYLKSKGTWLDDEKNYYGNLHVKDISGPTP